MTASTLDETIGFSLDPAAAATARERKLDLVNLKLASRGFALPAGSNDSPLLDFGRSLLANFEEKLRLLGDSLCPADEAIRAFLVDYLGESAAGVFEPGDPMVPSGALSLERHGLSRELSLPAGRDTFVSGILSSYRVHQGVCHNPAKDRRTTEGVFHIVEGGLPIPADKKAVPKRAFAGLLKAALHPPDDLLTLPYTSHLPPVERARTFVSLLLRPTVRPEVPGVVGRQTMEIRFFAPGVLVSNLDFVESIFGNAGDPFLPENDARLDTDGWTGHTGCVILAPHLILQRKKDLGLPHVSEASARQRADGMCWEKEDDLYNGGGAFKVACRDARGVMVTLIADSYYGYCKKEVKTQISFAANLLGQCEEEHAGGALAFPSFDHGESFVLDSRAANHTWAELVARQGAAMTVQPEGYGIDTSWPDIVYVPENARISLRNQRLTWTDSSGTERVLKLLAGHTYVYPSGYKVEMGQSIKGQRWRLVGTQAEGTFCHKPCTVSGGGKSEISKALSDAMITGPVIIGNFADDIAAAQKIIDFDFGHRFKNPREPRLPSRPLLSPDRSFGSVVRMLTPSELFTDEYNAWLESFPRHVRDLILVVKRRYRPEWGADWRSRFSVDWIDGQPGIELKFRNQKLYTRYLRVGFNEDGSWRTFSLRKDFAPAVKLQREDDITASTIIPKNHLSGLHPALEAPAYKFAVNCEYRLFQRPDDAVIRGYDRHAEADFAKPGQFFSNYEPLPRALAQDMIDDAVRFGQFTAPMQDLIKRVAAAPEPEWFVCTAIPRLVDGKPTKNPRYLQTRPDLENPRAEYLAEVGARLFRRLPANAPVLNPVHAILPGRRNNPAEPGSGIRPLAVYGPVHHQELPELLADLMASLTGKSPSTTGAGSEGALTKGPFNALLPIHDLNAALLSFIVTGSPAFTTAAGHIGRKFRVEHDVSLIIPEVWARMYLHEREPEWLLHHGCLEPVRDFTHRGRTVEASRLGFRITEAFVTRFFGRVFADPAAVLTADQLRPELQSLDDFADGVEHIIEGHQKAAAFYFADGAIDLAVPPLAALLRILAHGHWEGKRLRDPDFRRLFQPETVLGSDWYRARLEARLAVDRRLWRRHADDLRRFLDRRARLLPAERAEFHARLAAAEDQIAAFEASDAVQLYSGTLGIQPELV
ncbi:MAG: hypothetical protein ACKV19_09330 [Verrucomicrobiales bacterium]